MLTPVPTQNQRQIGLVTKGKKVSVKVGNTENIYNAIESGS